MKDNLRARIQPLNTVNIPKDAECVLYIMSRDQRVDFNHVLLIAQNRAIELQLPLLIGFIAYNKSGQRAYEHFEFVYEGLQEVAEVASAHSIPFIVRSGLDAAAEIKKLINNCKPAEVYFDFSPLRGPVMLKKKLAKEMRVSLFVVDTHNIVPVWAASDKQEFAARTLRPKIHKRLADFLEEPAKLKKHPHQLSKKISSEKLEIVAEKILKKQKKNGTKIAFTPGQSAAKHALDDFIQHRLKGYAAKRNDPANDHLSGLSPYLHYGQLASLEVILAVEEAAQKDKTLREDVDTLIEEMVVRKELSDNFCYYNQEYDSLDGAPEWAKKTLKKHLKDEREHLYTLDELENAKTHDDAWNAAQHQLRATGKIHGYMRMYWAKKVLEWTKSPEQALEFLLYLNDFYHIDGGDPNGYVGIMWSIAGVHDRPWGERDIFGQIRYMNANGLKRKFKIKNYIKDNS